MISCHCFPTETAKGHVNLPNMFSDGRLKDEQAPEGRSYRGSINAVLNYLNTGAFLMVIRGHFVQCRNQAAFEGSTTTKSFTTSLPNATTQKLYKIASPATSIMSFLNSHFLSRILRQPLDCNIVPPINVPNIWIIILTGPKILFHKVTHLSGMNLYYLVHRSKATFSQLVAACEVTSGLATVVKSNSGNSVFSLLLQGTLFRNPFF